MPCNAMDWQSTASRFAVEHTIRAVFSLFKDQLYNDVDK